MLQTSIRLARALPLLAIASLASEAEACVKGAGWFASEVSSLPDCIAVEFPTERAPVTTHNQCTEDITFTVQSGQDEGLTATLAPDAVWNYAVEEVNDLDADVHMLWEMASEGTTQAASGDIWLTYEGWDCPGGCHTTAGTVPSGIAASLIGIALLGLRRRRTPHTPA